ncbi:hypothetical protein D6219_07500 [Coxiella burnetii]|uniref:hypothetical protein n=2 Tax=Coxiella burnetii TaxID=777 RepID=UPI00036890A7|nr:hypothetical protein [Coxiella burnetii]AZV75642.1 hypothetical protein D6219_07500 [Coxiella burnetii]PNT86656.1 hypothetical protein C2L93_01675 [Coxiella burnetii]
MYFNSTFKLLVVCSLGALLVNGVAFGCHTIGSIVNKYSKPVTVLVRTTDSGTLRLNGIAKGAVTIKPGETANYSQTTTKDTGIGFISIPESNNIFNQGILYVRAHLSGVTCHHTRCLQTLTDEKCHASLTSSTSDYVVSQNNGVTEIKSKK